MQPRSRARVDATDRAQTRRTFLCSVAASSALLLATAPALAEHEEAFSFASIDGGRLSLDDWAGSPILVVNTASLCGFTPQYEALQRLYDEYRTRGLGVLAVPSDDFRQELGSNDAVKDFCDLTFALDLPMTEITKVRGRNAHPFYRWLSKDYGIRPAWNFNKVLLGRDGMPVAAYGSHVSPLAPEITGRIEALLAN